MHLTRMSTVTLISSCFALAAGAFTMDVRTEAPSRPPVHRPTNEADVFITRTLLDKIHDAPGLSITARSIRAYTAGGVVKLRGKVIYKQERELIVAAALAIPGVRAVDDRLSIVLEQ